MEPLTLGLLMGGAGWLKSELIDKPRAEKQRKLAAATQMYSPWTKLQAQPVQEADPFGSALQFGTTGAMMGAGLKQAELNEALANRLNSGGSPIGYGKPLGSFWDAKEFTPQSLNIDAAPIVTSSPKTLPGQLGFFEGNRISPNYWDFLK